MSRHTNAEKGLRHCLASNARDTPRLMRTRRFFVWEALGALCESDG